MTKSSISAQSGGKFSIRLIVLLLIAWALLTFQLGSPWYGVQDSYRVWIPSAVRNYEIYGVDQIGLMVVRDSDPVNDIADLYIYSHHPPLLAWIPALLTQFTGFNELSVRYAFACATLLGIVAMYVITRRLYNDRVAWWAAAFYGLVPMVSYMGRVPGHDPLGLLAALLFTAVTINWLRQPNRARFLALLFLAWMAVWTAWPAVFMVAGVGLGAFFLGNMRQRIGVIGIGVWCIVALIVLLGSYQLQWDQSIDSLLDAFVWRTSEVSGVRDSDPLTISAYLGKLFIDIFVLITPGVLVMSILGLFPLRKRSSRTALVIVGALFFGGLSYLLAFRNASYIHDYYKVFLLPSMAIVAAIAWVYLRMRKPPHRVLRPVMDGMLLTTVLLGLFVFGVLHYSAHQPEIDAIIDSINTASSEDDHLSVYFNYPGYDFPTGMDRVVKFYTFRRMDWNMPPEEVLANAQANEGRTLYFFCRNPDHEESIEEQQAEDDLALLEAYPHEAIYEDHCVRYELGATNTDQ
ncbi:MAG: glycosyltransferase family 39 protein [Aggregatilineales bacterium]